MKLLLTILIISIFFACNNKSELLSNNYEFKSQIDSYLIFIDTINGLDKNREFIYLESSVNYDTTQFFITIYTGSYILINNKSGFVDFIRYKEYDFLLVGDFPNPIVNINPNKDKELPVKIMEKRFPEEYKNYLIDHQIIIPAFIHYAGVKLVFKKEKLISIKREFNTW